MIYTLTLNASLDYLVFTDSVKPGEIHKINEYELYPHSQVKILIMK